MRVAKVRMKGITPYSQSKPHRTPKLEKEHSDDYEKRTWRERAHVNEEGFIVIPAMAFKNCLTDAAKFLGIQIAGRNKERYTKHFVSGILVVDGLVLPVKRDDCEMDEVFGAADGKPGGSKRVWKRFPLVRKWGGEVTFYILDDVITPAVFEQHIREAGQLVGIGRWRPARNGVFGRFVIESVEWS